MTNNYDCEFYERSRNLHDENDDDKGEENDTEAKEAVDHFEFVFDVESKYSCKLNKISNQTGSGIGGERDQQN